MRSIVLVLGLLVEIEAEIEDDDENEEDFLPILVHQRLDLTGVKRVNLFHRVLWQWLQV